MNSHRYQLLTYVVVQAAFIVLDLFELWRMNGKPRLHWFLRANQPLVLFLGVIWLVYFALQNSLLLTLPEPARLAHWLARRLALESTPLPPLDGRVVAACAAMCGLSYLIASWFDYALHRWLLHHPRGWWMHETHHLPTVVCNGMPGISVRPFVAPTVLLTYLGTSAVLLFGIKLFDQPWLLHWYLVQWPALVLFFTLVGSASHSCFLRRYWSVHTLLRRLWLVTPQEHILHHDARLAVNYGNFASCWDRWLGTYLDPSRHQPRAIGLAYDQDFLGALCRGRWKLSARWRRKFQLGKVCALTTD